MISRRMEICKEIIRDQLHEKPEYFEAFMMTVYCFDDPTKQEQVCSCARMKSFLQEELIQVLGASSNQITEVFIHMADWEKFEVAR